jgi:glycosyltransferase involved in cell wall biosynthesis
MHSQVIEATQGQAGTPAVHRGWHLITGEYPPQTGGVSDYTYLMATRLAAEGEEVHVWCPSYSPSPAVTSGITVHQQLGTISQADLRRVSGELERYAAPRRLLVQWVPHGYGYRSMNLAFCWWLWTRARRHGDRVELIVHEPYLSFRAGVLRQNAAALVHRAMAILLLNAATRVWVTIPDWERRLRPYALGRRLPFQWLPIFSNVPVAENPDHVRTVRSQYATGEQLMIGHFGTFGSLITTLLDPILLALAEVSGITILLMGHGSEQYRDNLIRKEPRLANLVRATGKLPAEQLSYHLSACDVMVQPYPDGVSSRRGSFMAGLSHGKPIITTYGHLSEPLWSHTNAAIAVPVGDTEACIRCVRRLCDDASERQRVASAALDLYRERFDISHAVAALRQAGIAKEFACAS